MPDIAICPYTGRECASSTYATMHEIAPTSVGGASTVALVLGQTFRVANFGTGTICPEVADGALPAVGDRVPVVTGPTGVALRVGPTATSGCIELHPWG